MKVAFVIFTKNEQDIIESVIVNLKKTISEIKAVTKADLFLWDDSSDATPAIAKKLSVSVLEGSKQSLGLSYYQAMKHFSEKHEYDYILTMDGDGQVDVKELPLFFETITLGYDLIVASRFKNTNSIKYQYPLINHFGVLILVLLIKIATFKKFTDAHGGIRLMRREVANDIKFLGKHSYVQETIIDATNKGYKVCELSSVWKERIYGESRVVSSPYRYARKMFLPLFMRANLHLLIALVLMLVSLFNDCKSILYFVLVFTGLEIYKQILFRFNQKLI